MEFRIRDKKWYEAGAMEGDKKFNMNLKKIIRTFLVERTIIEFRRPYAVSERISQRNK